MRRPLPLAVLAAAATLAVSTAPAAGQSAREVVETTMERYTQRMEGIENYTLVQTVSGSESTLYFERVESESGHPRFRPVTRGGFLEAETGRATGDGRRRASLGAADPYAAFDEMASRAELRGTESVDGRDAYVIAVHDMSGIDLGWADEPDGAEASFEPRSATMWIDTDRYLVLRWSMAGTSAMEGRRSEIGFDARMSDYREVDGMLHPFRTEITIEGIDGSMSPEQREDLRRAREQMERQLEGMSDEQRAMVEKMMKDRMPDMEALAEGTMTMTTEVRELRVNEGPPEGMQAAADRQARVEEARERRTAEREEQQRRREEEARRAREPEPMGPAEHQMRYPRFRGLYESTGERDATFFVTERCGSGSLAIGSMRGDVAPWIFDEVGEGEFRASPISPGGQGMHVRFGAGPGGKPVFEILTEGWEEFGSFRRSGAVPERWERCMQPRPR